MSAGLEETLRSLHQSVDGSQLNKELAADLVEDVKQLCTHELGDREIDLTCALLFHNETGLMKFLHKAANLDVSDAKATALNLLSEFIQKAEKKILPYAVKIKDASVKVYSIDRFAKVKNAAIPVLIKVLELSAGAAMGKDLDIDGLIKKFFGELSKSASKLAASVRSSIYNLLGVIAEVYPDLMAPYADRLVGIYVNTLKQEMMSKSKDPEMPVIAGCFEGLTAFMQNFTQSADEGSKYAYEIFKYARMAINPKIELKRYDVPRAGLKLFAKHAGQFRPYLMDVYREMYHTLLIWSRHHNRDVLHDGVRALEAFTKEISEALVENASEGQKDGAVFKFFLLEFRSLMKSKNATLKEVSMAIRGYGLLAAPCRTFLSEDDVQFMFGEMISKCEHQFFGSNEDLNEKLIAVPSYLTALANIIRQVETVPASYAIVLERLVISLMENIPQVYKAQQFVCFKSILLLLLTLMGKSTVFPQMLESIVYQGLLRTCSHPVVSESGGIEAVTDQSQQIDGRFMPQTSYKDYLPLWSHLLESARIKELASDNFTIADRVQLTMVVYNQLMASILKILQKLDLEHAVEDENEKDAESAEDTELVSADPTTGVIAKRPKDFQVFINLVDFCKDILVTKQISLFHSWVFTFTHTLITMSTRHPVVSGFYKLLSITMTVANKLDFFKEVCEQVSDDQMDVDDEKQEEDNREKRDTFLLIKKFSKEVLVRIKQYRDDLLASCLTLILSLPRQIIAEQMSEIVPAIQTTFTLGLSYLPLANIGLGALEQWAETLPPSVLNPHYKDILPSLDAYLRTDSRGSEEAKAEATVMVKSRSTLKREKAPIRLVRAPKELNDSTNVYAEHYKQIMESQGSQLSHIRQRILRYLGNLGGSVNHELLAKADQDVSKEAIAWDSQKHLLFSMPFRDMKPEMYFDQFLPQVVKLSQQASDRQTKVAASELLHSLVLYCLGRGAHRPGQTRDAKPMGQLYRRLFPTLLTLACDVEQVCKDLFEPLVIQLIHWFTSSKMAECPETMALLDCIFDGIIQEEDTALRDFSARCLKEFLQWSLKQSSKKAAEKNPVNAKSVFKRIRSFALHPSAAKRFGAALAFNSIYTVFREEEPLVDRFTFEILDYFVQSLSIAHKDEKSLGTQKQCSMALDHLERIIKVKAELLKKDTGVKRRPEPSSWSSRKLEIALRWLTRQCGNPQTECRHACMKQVYNLCALLPGVKTPTNFFTILLKADGPQYFLKRFEGGGSAFSEAHGLLVYSKMHDLGGSFSPSCARKWFDLLLASLDCYCWLFGEDLLSPSQMFTGKGSEISKIFSALTYFIEKLALKGIKGAAAQFDDSDDMLFTPREEEDYNRMKCTVIIRAWNFLSILLAKHNSDAKKVVPPELWCEDLWKLLCACVVQPTAVGFDMADTEIMQQLPKEMKQVLAVLAKCLQSSHMDKLKGVLSRQLASEYNLVEKLPKNFTSSLAGIDCRGMCLMAEGYSQLHAVGLLSSLQNLSQGGKSLPIILMDNVFQGIIETDDTGELVRAHLTPTALALAKSLLSLSLDLGLEAKKLVKALMDETQIREALRQGAEAVAHGGLFFTLMSSVINSHVASDKGRSVVDLLMAAAASNFSTIGGMLVSLLDFVARDKGLRKRYREGKGPNLCKDILSQWSKLATCWGDDAHMHNQSLILMLLTKMLLIDSKCVSDPTAASFADVFDMYLSMLKDPRTTMSFKNQVLDLLPFFASLEGNNEQKLKDGLNCFIADNFPLKSSDFAVGTHQYNDYVAAIDKLLVAMEMSGSLMLLEILISVFCREPQHRHEDAIQAGIARFVKRLPADREGPCLEVPFEIFANDTRYPPEIRRSAIERVCLPLLRLVSLATLVDFFVKHIQDLISPFDTKLNKNSEDELGKQLTIRICCFQLLELMYARLPKEKVKSQTSPINNRFSHGKVETGNEMTQKITKAAQEAKSEDSRGEATAADLRRQYHCHAYNLMMAIISCVQTELKFYKGFLFQDNVTKGQFLLDNIIDKDARYEFQVELESPVERRKKFVSIRSEALKVKSESGGTDGDDSPGSSGDSWVTPSLHLASQYLADSSLSDDVLKYDFSMSSSASGQTGGSQANISRKSSSSAAPDETVATDLTMQENYLELEMDVLNQHECMAPLIALIRHMVESKISPAVPEGTSAKEMPGWMPYLFEKLTNYNTHINIKLFVAKLVMNCSQIFQPFAKSWLQPLCQLLFTSEVSEQGLNYFAVDLIVTMLSWHTVEIPEDSSEGRAMASRVVQFVIGNIYHHNRQIFRNNLELLKTLLECWGERVEIPYEIVFSLFKAEDMKSLKLSAGAQVLGVIVTGGLPAYGPSAPVDRNRYLRTFFNLMTSPLKKIHAAAAEVTGLILHRLVKPKHEDKVNEEEELHEDVRSILLSIAAASKIDNFIKCVHSIHKGYPAIAESPRILNKLLYLLPSLSTQSRPLCLEVILGCLEKIPDPYLELHSKGLVSFLEHRDEEIQLVSLKIVLGMMEQLQPPQMLAFMPAVAAFSRHNSAACKAVMLDILQWVYDNYRENEDADSIQIMTLTKEALLRGLSDEDIAQRVKCQNFWGSNTRLPEGTLERTVSLLEAMYSPNTETQFLAYATNLLLEATSRSPDYQRPMFEHALTDCTFHDYTVQSSWRQRHAAMTPLFAATQMSQSLTSDSGSGDDQMDGGQLRATQDGSQQFTATVDMAGTNKAFNWLTQSSLDTFADTSSTIGGDSQLLFKLGNGAQGGRSRSENKGKRSLPSTSAAGVAGTQEKRHLSLKPVGLNQAGASAGASTSSDKVDGPSLAHDDVWRLKRRFMKDTDDQRIYFARKNIRIKRMREEAVKEQRARRENQVTLYRKYRIGDFPDIQIKHQYLIAPLQALAHLDSTIANLLFTALFEAIFSEMDKLMTEREVNTLIEQMNKGFEAMLSQSVLFYPPFIGCILTIMYKLRSSLKVPVTPLGNSAVVSNQQTLGILVLEEQLIQDSSSDSSASNPKRPRQAREETNPQTDMWMELSRLYKSIGEFDVLQGIFSGRLGTKGITGKAIEAESRCDYKAAYKLYEEALGIEEWPDSDPHEAEVGFWDDGRMECLDNLTDWKDLEAISSRGIDDAEVPNLDRVWEDGFYEEHFLPYLIRSKLKLMLTSDDQATTSGQNDLYPFVTQALKDEQKKQHLQSRYCKELSQMFLWQRNYDTARHYTSLAFERFLQDWSSTTTLMQSNRRNTLHGLQGLVEQQEFLDHIASLETVGNLSTPALTQRWKKKSPHLLLDPVTVWDDIVTNRTLYLSRLAEKIAVEAEREESQESQNFEFAGEEGQQKLAQMSLKLSLAMADSCRVQNNFAVTLKILKRTQSASKRMSESGSLIDWVHLYARTYQSKAKTTTQWTDRIFMDVCSTLAELGKISKDPLLQRPQQGMDQCVLTSRSLDALVTGLLQQPDVSPDTRIKLAVHADVGNSSASNDEIIAGLIKKGYSTLKSVAAVSSTFSEGDKAQDETYVPCDSAHLELAKFCDKYLHLKEDEKLSPSCDISHFPATMVKFLLTAIKGGIIEARQRFPRLLQVAANYPDVKDIFIKTADEVPSWMFLLWISQMTAVLDKPEAVVVAPILTKIATEYPQALIYPFRMSSEGYNFGTSKEDKRNQETVEKIEALCNVPLVNKFISALEQFGQPDMIFKDWCGDVKKVLANKKISKAELQNLFQEIVSQLFEAPTSSDSFASSTVVVGDYRKGFSTAVKDSFFKLFGPKGEKLAIMSAKDFSRAAEQISSSITSLQEKKKLSLSPPTKIKDYCPWMVHFNASRSGDDLEIPGQYDGLKKPLPEYHVKIAGFDERVLVMSSLRKPKRIMIRGNDERDYPYLVKSGEDLRMDQRIETLFFIMNCVMKADPACRQRRLHLRTYQVVSMTPRVGLIEWMRDTQPLKEFLLGALTDDERRFLESNQAPIKQHMNWANKAADKDNKRGWQGVYDNVYIKYSCTETTKEFRQKEGKIPWNLSRRALQRLSSSPEAFYVLRSEMLQSHSVVCICQYLLGIGDRHLSNFMVNLRTGQMVGIDFGHAFGSATQFLPVPELMPFRLTRQLSNLNLPHQVKGQTESCMRHTLRALRADSDLLLSTMDVFVKEPHLDWLNFASKQMQEGKETDDADEDDRWYPKQKIQFAERKLKGDHPSHIMRDELELGHSKRKAFKSLVGVLTGDRQSLRAQLPAHGLTVEQQVTALIDQATDPNILGRTWGGWDPWI